MCLKVKNHCRGRTVSWIHQRMYAFISNGCFPHYRILTGIGKANTAIGSNTDENMTHSCVPCCSLWFPLTAAIGNTKLMRQSLKSESTVIQKQIATWYASLFLPRHCLPSDKVYLHIIRIIPVSCNNWYGADYLQVGHIVLLVLAVSCSTESNEFITQHTRSCRRLHKCSHIPCSFDRKTLGRCYNYCLQNVLYVISVGLILRTTVWQKCCKNACAADKYINVLFQKVTLKCCLNLWTWYRHAQKDVAEINSWLPYTDWSVELMCLGNAMGYQGPRECS